MGHYDDAYEHDNKLELTELQKQYKAALKVLHKLQDTLPERGECYGLPERFHGHLEDLENYLKAHIEG